MVPSAESAANALLVEAMAVKPRPAGSPTPPATGSPHAVMARVSPSVSGLSDQLKVDFDDHADTTASMNVHYM